MTNALIYTDLSGSITTGGQVQTVAALNLNREYFSIQNEDLLVQMRVSFDPNKPASATVGWLLLPGYVLTPSVPPVGPVTVYCATTGIKFSAMTAG